MERDVLTTSFIMKEQQLGAMIDMLIERKHEVAVTILNGTNIGEDEIMLDLKFSSVLDALYFGIYFGRQCK
jgi:hypothetical protein